MGTDRLAASAEVRPDLGVDTGDLLRDRQRLESCEHVFDKRSPARSARGTVSTVEQLTDRNDADRPLLMTDEGLKRCGLPRSLPVDQKIRVD